MKLLLRNGSERVEVNKLPAYLLSDGCGWITVYYDQDEATREEKRLLERGIDCTIYILEVNG